MNNTISSLQNVTSGYPEWFHSNEEKSGTAVKSPFEMSSARSKYGTLFTGNLTADVSAVNALVITSKVGVKHITGHGLHSLSAGSLGSAKPRPLASLLDDLGEQFTHLMQLAQLTVGWDGVDAVPPTREAVSRTAEIVISVAVNTLRTPVLIAPLTDGSLQIEWSEGSKRLELVVDTDGTLSADLISGINTSHRQFKEYETIEEADVQSIISRFAD